MEVLDLDEEVTTEVKKNNLFYDMENKLELHIGDTLIFYFLKNWYNNFIYL